MTTRQVIRLLILSGPVLSLITLVACKRGDTALIILAVVVSLIFAGLMVYAFFREKALGDKSERISPRTTGIILCGVGLWTIFCFYRALAH